MPIPRERLESLTDFFQAIKLGPPSGPARNDNASKVNQILSYLDIVNAQVAKLSKNRRLVFVDSGAGNCYLSFLLYHFFGIQMGRELEIHCIDTNARLMENAERTAGVLGFRGMFFHEGDISDFLHDGPVDVCYSLHACDTATDKALFLGIRHQARCILSVSCCQHSMESSFRNRIVPPLAGYKSVKNRLVYMVADVMRAKLMEMHGYRADIFDFTSSRNTDKNMMIRARKGPSRSSEALWDEYRFLREGFGIRPELERLLLQLKQCEKLAS